MAGLDPAIHVFRKFSFRKFSIAIKTWMPATSAGMTFRWLTFR
jgi:hypothetical protein